MATEKRLSEPVPVRSNKEDSNQQNDLEAVQSFVTCFDSWQAGTPLETQKLEDASDSQLHAVYCCSAQMWRVGWMHVCRKETHKFAAAAAVDAAAAVAAAAAAAADAVETASVVLQSRSRSLMCPYIKCCCTMLNALCSHQRSACCV